MTLSQSLFPTQSLLQRALMVLGGSMFIAIAAQVSVPMFPVPMTLQTLAILIVGMTFGSRMGALTLVAYLGEGAMGLPVFANGMNGAVFFGPTAGFLIGFVGLAYLAGLAVERGVKGPMALSAAMIGASALLYVPGIAWPMAVAKAAGVEAGWVGKAFGDYYFAYFMQPFLIGDAVKAVIAALVVSGGAALLIKKAAPKA